VKILITGGTGFIGSKLTQRLEEHGHVVIPFKGRVHNKGDWDDCPIADACIHLAAENNLYLAEEKPLHNYLVNYWGTMLAAHFCRTFGMKLIFASTDTVIGLDGLPCSVYDSHKLAAEKAIMSIPMWESVTLRLSTVYGPSPAESKEGRGIINRWVKMALRGESLKVYEGVSDKRRDYIHVDDVIKAFVKALEAPKGVYNVCTGIGTTVWDMACLIAQEALIKGNGKSGGVGRVPDPKGLNSIEYRTWICDHHLFTWATGWKPQVSVHEGVRRTVEASRNEYIKVIS